MPTLLDYVKLAAYIDGEGSIKIGKIAKDRTYLLTIRTRDYRTGAKRLLVGAFTKTTGVQKQCVSNPVISGWQGQN